MKIAYISTYLPRQCGIATFTNDLYSHIDKKVDYKQHEQHVFALTDEDGQYDYPEQVKMQINVQNHDSYLKVADYINNNDYDICILQHEYGIFGGNSGVFILSLIHNLNIPLVSILHTILEKPSADEKAILIAIAQRSSKLIVMNSDASSILEAVYHIPKSKLTYIPHGVPTFPKTQLEAKKIIGYEDKKIILTFGFIGRSKGIEVAIKALPEVVKNFPDVVYLVVGKTHPNILKSVGEEYRESLVQLIADLGVQEHVKFVNEFLDDDKLSSYLSACDVYITPYISEAQITSGTLSFAIGAGAAVLSTPYLHAKDLLANGRGILFPFNDSEVLAKELNGLFADPAKLSAYRKKSHDFGRHLSWSNLVDAYIDLFKKTTASQYNGHANKDMIGLEDLPKFDLSHIKRLTNNVGIIQHATYSIPNYKEGYCLDDNARALLLVLASYKDFRDEDSINLISTYLSYMNYVQLDDGRFRNFLSFDNRFLDQEGSDDSFGRAIWSLGYLFKRAPYISYYQIGKEMFFKAIPQFSKLTSIRAIAYTILGITHYLEHQPNDERMLQELRQLIDFMLREYKAHQSESWQWYERIVSYDNAILPLAMLRSYTYLKDEELKDVGLKTLDFLDEILFTNGYLSAIGNQGWYSEGKKAAKFGQQPIEVTSVVSLYNEVYKLTGKVEYLEKCVHAFQWFSGANDLKLTLFDSETKGCCDGLETHGINRNQGAESTVCFWLSHIVVHEALSKFKG
ncbi:glycosyltransferase family 4 protein [Sphingobacterium hungaricum]